MKLKGAKSKSIAGQRNAAFYGPAKKGSFFSPVIQRTPLSGGRPISLWGSSQPGTNLSLMGTNVPSPVVHRSEWGISATVYFAQDSIFLNNENHRVVEGLSRELEFLVSPRAQVNAHASSEGRDQPNQLLSEQRRSLVIALLSNNNPPAPLNFTGGAYGESMPAILETATAEAELERQRSLNRRVEISILFDPASIVRQSPPRLDLSLPAETRERILEEERNRRIFEAPNIPPVRRQSVSDLVNERIDQGMNRVMTRLGLPEWMHGPLRDAARSAVARGANAILDQALDGFEIQGEAREAIQSTVGAAAQSDVLPDR